MNNGLKLALSKEKPKVCVGSEMDSSAASSGGILSDGIDCNSKDTISPSSDKGQSGDSQEDSSSTTVINHHHDLSEVHPDDQRAWDSPTPQGRRESLDDSRGYSTEDETSDWEAPVDVELEVLPVGQRQSKASWSAVKAVTKWMPTARSSNPWSQLAGHQGSFLAGPEGSRTVWKLKDASEEKNLRELSAESGNLYSRFVPHYHGTDNKGGKDYIQLQDLQSGFRSPSVMDIKMGIRSYQQKELAKALKESLPREDLYKKMVSVDPEAPTTEEREKKAITKTRYLKFRDDISSSSSLGFRIEGIKTPTIASKDFKKTRTDKDVQKVLCDFVGDNKKALDTYISLLQKLRTEQQSSQFFRSHEMVGSSLLFLHDASGEAGVWMIDFAKCCSLPDSVTLDHVSPWCPGNYEDRYCFGLDTLLSIFQRIAATATEPVKAE